MRVERFELAGAKQTADAIRAWATADAPSVDVAEIEAAVRAEGDDAVLRLTRRFDATEGAVTALRVEPDAAQAALDALDSGLRASLELAAANIRQIANSVLTTPLTVDLPQGHRIRLRDVPVSAAGIYAPGGQGAYPSSVLMCAIPARIAGVKRLVLASPPGPSGAVNPLVLASAALAGVDEIYAMGGAQAIFALAFGTESVDPVDVIAGPGNNWVVEAKRAVYGHVGIDSLAGPSELMVIAGQGTDPEWAALDLCAQAEHGEGGALIATAIEEEVLDSIAAAAKRVAAERGVGEAPLALVLAPDLDEAIDLANAFAPEHLELLDEAFVGLADRVTTAGSVFAGRHSATAFGDYLAGSNHVLPTGGTGRFSGPLGQSFFRRSIAIVEVPPDAAAKLAPHVDTIARAEGFPVHGESAMIRVEKGT